MDITGGEPTIYPDIVEVVRYGLDKGIRTCIITNGIVNSKRTNELLNAGIDDWLLSRHGLDNYHNYVTNHEGAYRAQEKFIRHIADHMTFRVNCVITKFNYKCLSKVVRDLLQYPVRVVNFINFNPHAAWEKHLNESKQFIPDLRKTDINIAVRVLEEHNITANIRYFPMCLIDEDLRHTVCNDLHVTFDPYEWDYCIQPKTLAAHKRWGEETSKCVEENGQPCSDCGLFGVCGGINRNFHIVSNQLYGDICQPIDDDGENKDFYYYRKNQIFR